MALYFTDRLHIYGGSGTYTLQGFDGTEWLSLHTIYGTTEGDIEVDPITHPLPVDSFIPTNTPITFRWIDSNGMVSNEVAVVVPETPAPPIVFHLSFDSSLGTNAHIQMSDPFDIDWGDGHTDSSQTNVSHTYTGTGNYTATVTMLANAPDTLLLHGEGGLRAIDLIPDTISNLDLKDNYLTSLPALPSHLANINIENNQITSLPPLPSTLNYLGCGNNHLTAIPALPAGITILGCEGNQLTSIPTLPASILRFNGGSNKLSSSEIDTILSTLATSNAAGGIEAFMSGQTPAATPSSVGLANKAALIGLGWNVVTD